MRFLEITQQPPDIASQVEELSWTSFEPFKSMTQERKAMKHTRLLRVREGRSSAGRLLLMAHGFAHAKVRFTRLRKAMKPFLLNSRQGFSQCPNEAVKSIWATYVPAEAKADGCILQSFLRNFLLFEFALEDLKTIKL